MNKSKANVPKLKQAIKATVDPRDFPMNLLGSKDMMERFADFYKENQNLIEVIKEYRLREFNQEFTYTKEENITFRQGLDTFPEFFKICIALLDNSEEEDVDSLDET